MKTWLINFGVNDEEYTTGITVKARYCEQTGRRTVRVSDGNAWMFITTGEDIVLCMEARAWRRQEQKRKAKRAK